MDVKLAWDGNVTGAQGYNLYYGTSSGSRDNVVNLPNVLTHTLDLWSPAKWFLMVTANLSAGESPASNVISVVVDPVTPPPPPPPPPPVNSFVITGPTDRTVRVIRRTTNTSKLIYLTVNKDDRVTYNGVIV